MALWEEASRIFDIIVDLPAHEQAERIRVECGEDEELLALVRRLIEVHDEGDSFLVPPHAFLADDALETEFPFGDYALLEELGRGGMGIVFRALHKPLGREVALKVLSPAHALNQDVRTRFVEEARRVAGLHDEKIITVYDVGEEIGLPFFTMELIRGGSLADLIHAERRAVTPSVIGLGCKKRYENIAVLVASLAKSLVVAHAAGIVHRDVKPQNVLIDEERQPYLVDFGIARDLALGSVTKTGAILGSPHYMSPEQAQVASTPQVDERTDIYSLGVVLYELLTMTRPFEGESQEEVFEKIRTRSFRPILSVCPEAPRGLVRICNAAMAERPDDRYLSSKALASDLDRFLGDEEPMPPVIGAGKSLGRHLSRRRLLYLSGLGATGLVLGGLGVAREFARRGQVHTYVRAHYLDGEELDGELFARRMIDFKGNYGSRVPLGEFPSDALWLDPGFYRFDLETESGRKHELFREVLGTSETLVIEGVFRRDPILRPKASVRREQGFSLPPPVAPGFCFHENEGVDVESFSIDTFEVSNADFEQFARESGRRAPPLYGPEGFRSVPADHPVVGITWDEALAFCEWADGRLPTHGEWELAARGPQGRLYPWGNSKADRGNASRPKDRSITSEIDALPSVEASIEAERRLLLGFYREGAIGCREEPRGETPSGIAHFLGNVSEWTETPPPLPVGEEGSGDYRLYESQRIVMGGAWDALTIGDTLAYHYFSAVGEKGRSHRTGFRCAYS